MLFQFNAESPETRHICESRKEGEWVVFVCPHCPDFERRMHLKTGQMKTRPAADPYILHEGVFVPVGLENSHSLPN